MALITTKISKDDYEKCQTMTVGEINNWWETHLVPAVIWGYGYYGVQRVYEENGEYRLQYKIGDTCE